MTSQNHAFKSANIVPAEATDYSMVVNHLLASSLAGQGQLWLRGELIQPHNPCYFKPESNLYRDTVKRDRRNGKELEYIHSAGTWIEQAMCAFELFEKENDVSRQGRLLHIIRESLAGTKEILAMRTPHFHAVLTKGPAMARQLADMVEAKVEATHCQVPSNMYASVYSELSANYVVEAAKGIARSELQNNDLSLFCTTKEDRTLWRRKQ